MTRARGNKKKNQTKRSLERTNTPDPLHSNLANVDANATGEGRSGACASASVPSPKKESASHATGPVQAAKPEPRAATSRQSDTGVTRNHQAGPTSIRNATTRARDPDDEALMSVIRKGMDRIWTDTAREVGLPCPCRRGHRKVLCHNSCPRQRHQRLTCGECFIDRHKNVFPLHFAEVWNRDKTFEIKDISAPTVREKRGAFVFRFLDHECPLPGAKPTDVIMIDETGVHQVKVEFCSCRRPGLSKSDQLKTANYLTNSTDPDLKGAVHLRLLRAFFVQELGLDRTSTNWRWKGKGMDQREYLDKAHAWIQRQQRWTLEHWSTAIPVPSNLSAYGVWLKSLEAFNELLLRHRTAATTAVTKRPKPVRRLSF